MSVNKPQTQLHDVHSNELQAESGPRDQLQQTLTTIMVASCFFVGGFPQLISSKVVGEVSCSSCVSLFFSDVAC